MKKRKRKAKHLPSNEHTSQVKGARLSKPYLSAAVSSALSESQNKIIDQDKLVSDKEDKHDVDFSPAMLNSAFGTSLRKEALVRNRKTPIISRTINRDNCLPRPKPYGSPLVWADDRQALCDSLPYYRAFQSSAYIRDGLTHGFLIDRDCGDRSYMDEEVVIARADGGYHKNEEGRIEHIKDYSSDNPAVRSFQNNLTRRVPLVLIIGKNTLYISSYLIMLIVI